MSWTVWMAIAVVILTVLALVKRLETRLVLLVAGLVMCLLSGDPLAAFRQFDKSMTNPFLITSGSPHDHAAESARIWAVSMR